MGYGALRSCSNVKLHRWSVHKEGIARLTIGAMLISGRGGLRRPSLPGLALPVCQFHWNPHPLSASALPLQRLSTFLPTLSHNCATSVLHYLHLLVRVPAISAGRHQFVRLGQVDCWDDGLRRWWGAAAAAAAATVFLKRTFSHRSLLPSPLPSILVLKHIWTFSISGLVTVLVFQQVGSCNRHGPEADLAFQQTWSCSRPGI